MTSQTAPRALLAEDEPVQARALQRHLAALWPELDLVAQAEDGITAVELALRLLPDVLFLDIKMPGLSGLEVAAQVADDWPEDRALPALVFVTAHDEFALQAFDHAALDYLLKPLQADRLARSVERLKAQLQARSTEQAPGAQALLVAQVQALGASAQDLTPSTGSGLERISVIRAGVGHTVRMIPVGEVLCFEASDKYVNVVSPEGEALVRMSLRALMSRIDASAFVQVHRGVMVNEAKILSASRDDAGHCRLHLRGLARPIKVSRAFAYQFRPM